MTLKKIIIKIKNIIPSNPIISVSCCVEKLLDINEIFNVPIAPLPIAIVNKLKVDDLNEGFEYR